MAEATYDLEGCISIPELNRVNKTGEPNMGTTAVEAIDELEARLVRLRAPGSVAEGELEGLPDPVRRYLRASIPPGTPLAQSARFRMRGSIRLGKLWIPFRARQILAPLHGFMWAAKAGGVIVGSDRYMDGKGAMDWKLFGLVRVVYAEGPDVSRSSAGRAGGEAVWVPTALLPRFGVTWSATDARHITASYRVDETELELHYTLADEARVRSIALDRWGTRMRPGPPAFTDSGTRRPGIRLSTGSPSQAPVGPGGSTGPTDGAVSSSTATR